ncbi:MAG TPA: prenyltransferase/squalene oxidase repeat-containing protein [Gemmata sp.]|nr:prenyltransferase/squalene oxidase repeat-containing protein [Gemmata sp.]
MSRLSLSLMLLILVLAGWSHSTLEQATAAADDPPKKEDPGGFGGRTGKEKTRLLKEFGGSEASEEAVMLGLAWLTQMQKKDGSWVYDGAMPGETSAATGMALLAFLGAGQSHKAGRYQQTVQAGLDWLIKDVNNDGRFSGASTMYGQGIATLALCEAYGLTQDKKLLATAQSTIDFIQKVQGQNGSWGYQPNTTGDNSIVGWQIQALHAASLTQDIKVDKRVIDKAIGFLNFSGAGPLKSMYGYQNSGGASPATNLTAIGLLMRYYIDEWRSDNRGFAEGVKGLMMRAPSPQKKPPFDMYYYYYATQVVRFYGKEEWSTWNEGPKAADGTRKGGVQDWLISLQDRTPTNRGSWPPERGPFIGPDCGKLGTTALCLLTLEVYYRYTPENANDPKKP